MVLVELNDPFLTHQAIVKLEKALEIEPDRADADWCLVGREEDLMSLIDMRHAPHHSTNGTIPIIHMNCLSCP